MLRRVALVRTDVAEELSASIIRVIRIGELGTTLAETNNRDAVRKRETSYPSRESHPVRPAHVPSPYQLSHPGFLLRIWHVEDVYYYSVALSPQANYTD
jgi:hypothetical protein